MKAYSQDLRQRVLRAIDTGQSHDLRGLGLHHQTLSQTTTRERSPLAKSDPRSSCQERSSVAGALASAVRSPSRCDTRRALPLVPGHPWHPGEPGQHQPRQSGFRLDTKKKTLVASEQNEAACAAWRELADQLLSQDLVFVDETGSHIAMTPLYAYARHPANGLTAKFPATMELS